MEEKAKVLCNAGHVLSSIGRVESGVILCRAALTIYDGEVTRRALYWAAQQTSNKALAEECLDWFRKTGANTDWLKQQDNSLSGHINRIAAPLNNSQYQWMPDRKSRLSSAEPARTELLSLLGIQPDDVVIGYIGNIDFSDGLKTIITACGQLLSHGHKIKLLLINDSPSAGDGTVSTLLFKDLQWCIQVTVNNREQKKRYYDIINTIVVPPPSKANHIRLPDELTYDGRVLVPNITPFIEYAAKVGNVSTYIADDAENLAQRIDQTIKQEKIGKALLRASGQLAERNVIRLALDADRFGQAEIATIAKRFTQLKSLVPSITIRIRSAQRSEYVAALWQDCDGALYEVGNFDLQDGCDLVIVQAMADYNLVAEGNIAFDNFSDFCNVIESLHRHSRPDAVYLVSSKPDNLQNGYHKRTSSLAREFHQLGYFVPVLSFWSSRYEVKDGICFIPRDDISVRRIMTWLRPNKVIAASNHENARKILPLKDEINFELIYEMRGIWHETFAAKMLEINSKYNIMDDRFYQREKEAELDIIRSADKIIFISPEMRDYITEHIRDRQIVHHIAGNGTLLPDKFVAPKRRTTTGSFVIGYFGTITYYEGIRLLLESVAELRDEEGLDDLKVLLIGTNSITHKHVLDLGKYDFVTYEGFKDGITKEFSRVNLLTIPRLPYTVCHTVEPLKPLEYFASGLPVLMSDCAALDRLANKGENCLTFRAGDKDHLKEKIRDVYKNGYPAEKIENARNFVKRSRVWNVVARDYANFLDFGRKESVYFLYSDKWWISSKWSGASVNVINEMILLSKHRHVYYNDVYVNDLIRDDGVFNEDVFRERCSAELKNKRKRLSSFIPNVMLPSRNYSIIFYRSGSGDNFVQYFTKELPEPKVFSHNYVEQIWKQNYVGFQNETSKLLAKEGLLKELGDDGTLGYSMNNVTPEKTLIRYQGCVTQRPDVQALNNRHERSKLKRELKSSFIIGVIGTIYEGTYPSSLIHIVRELRAKHPEKNISIVFYSINILRDIPKEDWVYVSNFDKGDQSSSLLQLDVIVNTWKSYAQVFSGSNKNLDAINFGIPLITAKTPSYVEQLGDEYPLYHDFENVDDRLSAESERRISSLIEKCFDGVFLKEVRSYLLYRREFLSSSVVSDLYDRQIREINNKKILLVAQNFNVGGVQKYSMHMLEAFANCDVTIAVSEPIREEKLAQALQVCPRIRVVFADKYDFSREKFDLAFLNSFPTDVVALGDITRKLHDKGTKIYPIAHSDLHAFTRAISNILELYDGIIIIADVVSRKLEENTHCSLAGKAHLITPVLDTDRAPADYAKPKKNRSYKIGYFGRVVATKGIEFLVKFFARFCRETETNYELHIYGPIARPYLRTFINGFATSEARRRIFLYDREIPPEERNEILKDLDALVYTTVTEGLPYTFLEAMELGTPVLSTGVGGIKHLITDEYNGMIFNFNDLYIEDLFEDDPYGRLLKIMKDHEERYYAEFARVFSKFVADDELFFDMSRNAITEVNERFCKSILVEKIKSLVYGTA